jgi:RNA polymerase sigma-70 factor (ECF subfamily)
MQALEAILPGSRVSSGSDTTQAAREFEELLTDGATLAFRVAMGVLHNRADAEEVAQETLLRAYRSFKGLRERGAFRGWLCRIAWRLALDRQRGTRRREKRELAVPETRPESSVEQLAAAGEFERHLSRAMDELPEKLRQTLVLAGIEGYSTREVAALLDVPEGTVKSRLHLARKQMAEKLIWHVPNMKNS